jgi:hypothetical protein
MTKKLFYHLYSDDKKFKEYEKIFLQFIENLDLYIIMEIKNQNFEEYIDDKTEKLFFISGDKL